MATAAATSLKAPSAKNTSRTLQFGQTFLTPSFASPNTKIKLKELTGDELLAIVRGKQYCALKGVICVLHQSWALPKIDRVLQDEIKDLPSPEAIFTTSASDVRILPSNPKVESTASDLLNEWYNDSLNQAVTDPNTFFTQSCISIDIDPGFVPSPPVTFLSNRSSLLYQNFMTSQSKMTTTTATTTIQSYEESSREISLAAFQLIKKIMGRETLTTIDATPLEIMTKKLRPAPSRRPTSVRPKITESIQPTQARLLQVMKKELDWRKASENSSLILQNLAHTASFQTAIFDFLTTQWDGWSSAYWEERRQHIFIEIIGFETLDDWKADGGDYGCDAAKQRTFRQWLEDARSKERLGPIGLYIVQNYPVGAYFNTSTLVNVNDTRRLSSKMTNLWSPMVPVFLQSQSRRQANTNLFVGQEAAYLTSTKENADRFPSPNFSWAIAKNVSSKSLVLRSGFDKSWPINAVFVNPHQGEFYRDDFDWYFLQTTSIAKGGFGQIFTTQYVISSLDSANSPHHRPKYLITLWLMKRELALERQRQKWLKRGSITAANNLGSNEGLSALKVDFYDEKGRNIGNVEATQNNTPSSQNDQKDLLQIVREAEVKRRIVALQNRIAIINSILTPSSLETLLPAPIIRVTIHCRLAFKASYTHYKSLQFLVDARQEYVTQGLLTKASPFKTFQNFGSESAAPQSQLIVEVSSTSNQHYQIIYQDGATGRSSIFISNLNLSTTTTTTSSLKGPILVQLPSPKFILPVFGVLSDSGAIFQVQPYLSAGSLQSLTSLASAKLKFDGSSFAKSQPSNRPLSLYELIHVLHCTSRALAWMTKRQIVHLDVKPLNILVDEMRNGMLIDFGISHPYGVPSSTRLFGTEAYVPPPWLKYWRELQAKVGGAKGGASNDELFDFAYAYSDNFVDVYSFGCMLRQIFFSKTSDALYDVENAEFLRVVGCLYQEGVTPHLPFMNERNRQFSFKIGNQSFRENIPTSMRPLSRSTIDLVVLLLKRLTIICLNLEPSEKAVYDASLGISIEDRQQYVASDVFERIVDGHFELMKAVMEI
jgi:serine/threonine protein kinase